MTRRNGEPLSAFDVEVGRGVGPSGTTDAGTRAVDTAPDPRLLVTVPEAGRILSIGRTRAFRLVNAGYLTSYKVGRSRLVPVSSIQALLADLAINPNLLNCF
jgi:excisionase family DNA binding protein